MLPAQLPQAHHRAKMVAGQRDGAQRRLQPGQVQGNGTALALCFSVAGWRRPRAGWVCGEGPALRAWQAGSVVARGGQGGSGQKQPGKDRAGPARKAAAG